MIATRRTPVLLAVALTALAAPARAQVPPAPVAAPLRAPVPVVAEAMARAAAVARAPMAPAPALAALAAAPIGMPGGTDQATDSLYRLARQALSRGDYRRAATLFQQVRNRNPRAGVAADALYWRAYSMYRLGGTTGLETALASLEALRDEHPRAMSGEARELRVRVCGELARQGDERCAAEIAERASASASASAASSAAAAAADEAVAVGAGRSRRGSGVPQGCPDEEDDERVAALNALLQMDAERALPILEKALARRDQCSVTLRRKAVFLVAQKRDAKAADLLLNAVRTDPDTEVREQAVFWLGQLHDDRAVTILEELIRSEKDEGVLDKAVFALSQQRSDRAGTVLRDLALRDNVASHLREQAIFWLGQQRNPANTTLLVNLYKRVGTEDLRDKIIFALSQQRSPASDKFLMDVAMDDKEDIEDRKKALFWAGQNRTVDVGGLGGIYDRVTNQEMREQVIFVLAQSKDPKAADKLFEIARTDKDREMRKKALFWLGQSRDPRVLKLLEEIISK